MAIQSDETLVTKGDLKTLYTDKILPYLGGNMMMQTGVSDYYSTDEKVVGVWIDKKPLYQKTINCGAIPSNSSKNVSISALNMDLCISTKGVMYNTNYIYEFPKPNTSNTTGSVEVWIDRQNKNLVIRGGSSVPSNYANSYITLLYTKTTDTTTSALTTPGCYDLNRPDLWPENKEIFFGNGLYGYRATGRITSSGNTVIANTSNVSRIINNGGCGITTWKVAIGSWFNSNNYSSNVCYNPAGTLEVNFGSEYVGALYDIWVTYTK